MTKCDQASVNLQKTKDWSETRLLHVETASGFGVILRFYHVDNT